MKKKKFIFEKIGEVDKEQFGNLLLAAKGGRTMKNFAEVCGVNPSTFSRIVLGINKGASSPDLLESIAEHAAPKSGVTLEKLAKSNGYKISEDIGLKVNKLHESKIKEALIPNILNQELVSRGNALRIGNIQYEVTSTIRLRPDALIMTDAFGVKNGVWYTDSIFFNGSDTSAAFKSQVKQRVFDRIAKFVFIALNPNDTFRPSRFSLIVDSSKVYNIIIEEFKDTYVPTEISIILIDFINGRITNEYVLPRKDCGYINSYFMTTIPTIDEVEYLGNEYDDEEEFI